MKGILGVLVGVGIAWFFVTKKYGSFSAALTAWHSPAIAATSSQPALASGGQGSGSLSPEETYYANTLPAGYFPTQNNNGNSAAGVAANHIAASVPRNGVAVRPFMSNTVKPVTPVAASRQGTVAVHVGAPTSNLKRVVAVPRSQTLMHA